LYRLDADGKRHHGDHGEAGETVALLGGGMDRIVRRNADRSPPEPKALDEIGEHTRCPTQEVASLHGEERVA
jgi:hypothetical protein